MTLVASPGIVMPAYPGIGQAPAFTSALIDATGEKVAFVGQVWNNDRTTKSITRVGFRFGAVTKSGGSALTVSLQDVSATAGQPAQPDEVQDQTVAIANADAGFVANTWYRTNALSANRSVTFGEFLAVVIEYSGGGRLGSDVVNITSIGDANAIAGSPNFSGVMLKVGTWSRQSMLMGVVLEFTDGTFGTLGSPNFGISLPCSATNFQSMNTGTTPDEAGLRFILPFEAQCEGAWFCINAAATADFDIVLYEGTTQKTSVSLDATRVLITSSRWTFIYFPTPAIIKAGVAHTIALKPTTANNAQIAYIDVSSASHFQAYGGGVEWYWHQRTDAGAWTPTTTRRPICGLFLSMVQGGVSNQPEAILGW